MRQAPGDSADHRRLSLKDFNTSDIRAMLAGRSAPLSEAEILRLLTGGKALPREREALFELHFSLYHALYRLKAEAGRRGFYIHLDPMRIRMVRTPDAGRCRHYLPDEGAYCGLRCDDSGYCDVHARSPLDLHAPSFDPLYDFYINPDNISFGTSRLLKKIMKGVIVYALRKGEIEAALACFGLERPTRQRIRKKYHALARTVHPDLSGGDESRMKELNHAYRVLMEVFAV
ncbi:MAG TPA: DNA-J related domain-containing protein [Spirochaetota bacterium]|mgnify:FL=1|nr:hypothetical protein [Spirochaetota bacterium]HPG49227.1 DNA-J related domain-containing protein [Spirochaetota bacterium]HPN13471.1 DNA-J related domain-containing protein [Spirochaetota bacterium]